MTLQVVCVGEATRPFCIERPQRADTELAMLNSPETSVEGKHQNVEGKKRARTTSLTQKTRLFSPLLYRVSHSMSSPPTLKDEVHIVQKPESSSRHVR